MTDLKIKNFYTFAKFPNPMIVEIFAREKGIDLFAIEKTVDAPGLENRNAEHLARNPAGQLPYLELEDGTVIAETITICEWLEEMKPEPAFIGSTPEKRAVARMWQRRMEEHFVYPTFYSVRFWTASEDCSGPLKNFFAQRNKVLIPGAWKDPAMTAFKIKNFYTFAKFPNPMVVEIFAREKGIDLCAVEKTVDLPGLEHRCEEHLARNPAGGLPYIELEDGTVIAETIAICEWLEEMKPEPACIGSTPEKRAVARMWQRRMEEHFVYPTFYSVRFWTASEDCSGPLKEKRAVARMWQRRMEEHNGPLKNFFFQRNKVLIPEAWKEMQAWALSQLEWLEDLKRKSRSEYIAGDEMTVVDIQVYATLVFFEDLGAPFIKQHGEKLPWTKALITRMAERPAVKKCHEHIKELFG
eukprot:CAMPEP_0204449536 /NCGR_PEP_ID=MMETSP0470-20130426/99887_1 /ASSEMBLY_ACC=CAM_ASM_000385 /TAXON_ID=2969 /ORGANISM="Oxyrrhis marina" /LENGTH=411 /DNA_ID=CAMNT_0051449357 /DNA_START=43 /DNA_END=1280 /DNA_ORIENTATION=+